MPRLLPERLLAALRPEATSRLELPRDLVVESRRRIRVGAAIGLAAYLVFLLFELSRVLSATDRERGIDLAHDLLGSALCAILLLAASLRPIGDRAVVPLALATEVLLSALISVAVPWAAYLRTGHVPTLTWVVPVIILFPLLVPAPPRLAFPVSILCALTMPAGLLTLASLGAVRVAAAEIWAACVTAAVGAGIAAVASRTVYGARRQVAALRTVGSYELLERLGQGGMGEVWKARHSLLVRAAAVKLILPQSLQGPAEEREAAVARFTREARVTASLRSPHTVELFDFGLSADGTLYYAMELLEGINLEHFVYQFGPIEPRRAVNWLQQACHSLGEAHDRRLIHRDIKPGNLFLCRYGRDLDFVKVLDFGLTKPALDEVDLRLTSPGVRLGTPGYMAPEQVLGGAADPRSDLYALGCVAYWLLAGRKPFESENAGDLLRQHVQATPPAISAPGERPVPARLEALVLSCLAKRPEDRPADADRLCAALGESLEGASWTPADARAWWAKQA